MSPSAMMPQPARSTAPDHVSGPASWALQAIFIVFGLAALLIIAAAIIGIGRGTEWGRPLATFSAGALVFSAYGLPIGLGIALILFRSRGAATAAATAAPLAGATGTA